VTPGLERYGAPGPGSACPVRKRRARKPKPVTEIRSYKRDFPEGCLCQWDPFQKPTPYHWETWWRITEVRPVCPVHGTAKAREDAVRALGAALLLAAERCCGHEPVFGAGGFECPSCGRKWPDSELYPPGEDPCVLPSRRLAAGGTAEVLGPTLAVIAEDRLF